MDGCGVGGSGQRVGRAPLMTARVLAAERHGSGWSASTGQAAGNFAALAVPGTECVASGPGGVSWRVAAASPPSGQATPPELAEKPNRQIMAPGHVVGLQMAAGAGAGAITKTAVAPLERLKILFQLEGMKEGVPRKYTGIAQASGVVYSEEGVRGFYKGNGANVLRVIPVYALKFAFNDTFKSLVRGQDRGPLGPQKLMLAGTMAGMMQQLVTYPLEVVRTRLSLGPSMGLHYSGIVDCIRQVVATEGPRGMYKGMGPTLLSGAPYVGLQMTIYSLLRRQAPVGEDGTTPLQWSILAGAGAGLVAQTITFPGDVIRRRMQTNGAAGAERLYKNSWHCTRVTVQREGWLALYKGLSTNVLRCLPGAGIQFAAYDTLKKLAGVHEAQLGTNR